MPVRRLLRYDLAPALVFAAIPIILLAAIAYLQLAVNVPGSQEARKAALQSVAAGRRIAQIAEAVRDAERSERGFLLTGRDTYLEPYDDAVARLPSLVDELIEQSGDDPDQRARIAHLRADLTTKLTELAETIAAMRARGIDEAMKVVRTDTGRLAMERVTEDLDAIAHAEEQRFQVRTDHAQALRSNINWTFIIGSIASVVALATGAVMLARAERRATRSEQLLQVTLDTVREGVAAFDENHRLRAWNARFASLIGGSTPSVEPLRKGEPLAAAGSDEARTIAGWLEELKSADHATGEPALVDRKGVRGASFEVYRAPIVDGGYVATFLDITERREAEEALRQSQKLEALGQMTGGVAHDFNNLLTVITGNLELLRRSTQADEKAQRRIALLGVAADRGAQLTRQLLAFARRQPLAPEVVDLGSLTGDILPLVRRAVGESVEVESVSEGDLWNTTVDRTQFQSVVLNLALNSRDAMPAGGKLTIEISNAVLDEGYAARHADLAAGPYVRFAVSDSGSGMDAKTMAKALDPFFTTKPLGKGTGLGLSQVYGFVKQSGGHLALYSEVGVGTAVKLYLPRTNAPIVAPAPQESFREKTGRERILLVDDDANVGATVAEMLTDLGYAVTIANSGEAAFAMLEGGLEVDLLLTDVVMPGTLDGRRLAERATAIRPSLAVLFTSGYAENAIAHQGRLDPGVELLSKPYDRASLAAKVRKLLDGVRDEPVASGPVAEV